MKHYKQTEDYTCDPACLMMAMNALNGLKMNKMLEMRIWDEANLKTVPGCLPQGLALSALKRGFSAEIICRKKHMNETTKNDHSVNIAKEQEKKCRGIVRFQDKTPSLMDIQKTLNLGKIPLVLVSAQRIHNIKSPHWIVVSRINFKRVYFHDPLLNEETSLNKKDFNVMFSQIREFLNKRILIIGHFYPEQRTEKSFTLS